MPKNSTDIVILAAGKGTRMQSALPKVLHPLAGRPLLDHVITSADTVMDSKKIIVTGHGAEQVEQTFTQTDAVFVQQTEQLGTAHAVQMALPHLRTQANVLILYGDVPLITPETISKILNAVDKDHIALLTNHLDNPTGYGRIVRNTAGDVESIVEQKDASDEQLNIMEINTGVLALRSEQLNAWLPQIDNNNAQNEYYLTDLIAIARSNGFIVNTVHPSSATEVEGVNNRQQLSDLERAYQLAQAQALMLSGTTLADPHRFDQRGTITAGHDNSIDVNCVFEGDVALGSGVSIRPNCHISDSTIGDGVEIKANSVIESAIVGNGAIVGPFARLRPGTKLGSNTKVGNFVETKKANVGDGSKINHLSYVGDANLGQGVNVGAGTITCNYDGVNKHTTDIGNDAFIGSNSTLIAPVSVADKGFVAAGTSVSKDVPEDSLAVGRAKQRNISGWKRPTKKDD